MTSRPSITSVSVAPAVGEFLDAAAKRRGTDIGSILEMALGARPVTEFPEAAAFTARLDDAAIEVLAELDWLLRTANPGTQMVFRTEYIGYRRFDTRKPSGAKASRSQMYASLLPRRSFIRVVVPLAAADYPKVDGVTDLSGRGHHGVGDMAIDVHSSAQARVVTAALNDWLGPPGQVYS